MSTVPVWWDDTADLWHICACVSACEGVGVCRCVGWSWNFQGDFNIYYCFPLLLDVSFEVTVSLPLFFHCLCPSLCLFFFFCLPFLLFSFCLLPVVPLQTGISLDCFLHTSLCFWKFSPLSHLSLLSSLCCRSLLDVTLSAILYSRHLCAL